MKQFLILLSIVLATGCTTTQHFSGEPQPWSQKAIVLLEFGGDGIFEHHSGIRISSVTPGGFDKKVNWDNTKMEFAPGRYNIQFETWSKRTLASTFLGGPVNESKVLKALQYGYNPKDRNNLVFSLEAGKIYVIHLVMKEVDGKAKRPIAYIEGY